VIPRAIAAINSFGERALLSETDEGGVRTSTVVATDHSDCLLVTLDREHWQFIRRTERLTPIIGERAGRCRPGSGPC
jgi:hypothetical protein